MKKKMKRAACAVFAALIAAAVLSMCGCSVRKKLIGDWDWKIYVPPETFNLEGMEDGVTLSMIFSLNKDGTYSIEADETATRSAWEEFIGKVVDFAVESAYKSAEESGVTRDSFDSSFLSMYGMPIREYMQKAMDEKASYDSTVAKMSMSGEYSVKDDKLYVWETGGEVDEDIYFTFKYKNGKLTLLSTTDPNYESGNSIITFPAELTRRAS